MIQPTSTTISLPDPALTEILIGALPANHAMHLTPDQALEVCAKTGITPEQLPIELLPVAARFARPPLSNFKVGAVGRSDDGSLFLGCNLEFAGLTLADTVHAEQFVVVNALQNGARNLAGIYVNASPCGLCRQFLYELPGATKIEIHVPGKSLQNLASLFADPFGPGDLGVTLNPFRSDNHLITLPELSESARHALAAANRSYAPYTQSPAGVSIRTREGTLVSGSYMENAAFNPTLPALQAALIALIRSGIDFADITEIFVAARPNAPHFLQTEQRAGVIAPHARVHRVFVSDF